MMPARSQRRQHTQHSGCEGEKSGPWNGTSCCTCSVAGHGLEAFARRITTGLYLRPRLYSRETFTSCGLESVKEGTAPSLRFVTPYRLGRVQGPAPFRADPCVPTRPVGILG